MTRFYCDICGDEVTTFKTVRLSVYGSGVNEEKMSQLCDKGDCMQEASNDMMVELNGKYNSMRAEIEAAKAAE